MSDVLITVMTGHMSGEYVCQITSQAGEVLEQTHRLQVTMLCIPPGSDQAVVTRLLSRPPLSRTRAG